MTHATMADRAGLTRHLPRDDVPPPDPQTRARWAERRAALAQESRIDSTPDGPRRRRHVWLNAATMATGRAVLRLTGLQALAMRRARAIRRTDVDVPVADLPPDLDGYRILHVTDPHFDGLPGLAEAIVAAVGDARPHLGLFGGDYRVASDGPFREPSVLRDVAAVLRGVRPRDGWLGVLGNHDPADIVGPLERLGLRMLVNETVRIRVGEARLVVAGTDDVHRFYTDAARIALEPPEPRRGEFALALIHSPELAPEAAEAGYGLYLAGHTHGGQIRPWPGRPPIVHLHRCRGLWGGRWRMGAMIGHTSRGAGVSGIVLRFACRGEVTLLTLRRPARAGGVSEGFSPVASLYR
jgi:uncharacterized protein